MSEGIIGKSQISDVPTYNTYNMGLDVRKSVLRGLRTTKGADHPGDLHSLISAFVIRLLESFISKLATSEISIF